jgi:hypothetical protein
MNQNILKYSFNKYGLEFIKYILDPQNLLTLMYFQITHSISMNPECGKQLVKHFTDLVNSYEYLYTSYSSHNYFILKHGIPDPDNLIIDFYFYLQNAKDILTLYHLLKKHYQNVVLYLELGIIFILPSNITERVNDNDFKFHYIIQITVLISDTIKNLQDPSPSANAHDSTPKTVGSNDDGIAYDFFFKERNINNIQVPKTQNFLRLKYVGKGNTLCIHSDAIDKIKNEFSKYKTRKIGKFLNYNEIPTYFVNNYLEYYLEPAAQ